MNKKITLTESALKNMIMEAVKEEMSNESWFGRTFGGAQSRGTTQMNDAMKLIQQSDQLIQQFRTAMQSVAQSGAAWNPQQQQGGQQPQQPQQKMNEGETNEVIGTLATAALLGGAVAQGKNFLAGKGDKNYELLQQAFKLRSDAYGFIARAIANGVQIDFSTFEDKLLGVTPQKAQAASGQATQQNNDAMATNWKQAEAEINQVVKGDFSNWPQKVKQAGWPDEKIKAYRQLANQNRRARKPAAQPTAPVAQQAAPTAGGTASAAPAGGNTAAAQPQQQGLTEAVINRVVKKYLGI